MTETQVAAWRPTAEQELLARAAVMDDDSARDAWAQWIARVDLTKLDVGSQRMLPLLSRNLAKLGVDHPALKHFSLDYRRNWAKNQLAMRHLEELLAVFDQRGIETIILKGAALLLRYYQDMGVRPMADFDVLVPVAQTEAAFAVLVEAGWHSKKALHLLSADHRAPFHGMGYYHDDKLMGCDLHWHVMHMNLAERYDVPFWTEAVPQQVGSVQSHVLCAEHQLIHTFFNGCMNEGSMNMRWLPDALVVFKHEAMLDWDRLVAQCQLLEFVQPVAAMLAYLRTAWAMPVPVEVIETLAQTSVRYPVRKVYESLNTRKRNRSGMQTFWILYTQFQLAQSGASGFMPFDFVRFLRHRWSLEGGVGKTLNYAWQRTRGVTAKEAREVV